jgi:hypothetical protein
MEVEEAIFLADFHQTVEKARQNIGMTGTLRPRLFLKVTKYFSMTVSTRSIQGSYRCIGLDPL